ncbi:phosphoenolpyruvate synthase, partial [Cycloclasticus sp. 44_32_T64]
MEEYIVWLDSTGMDDVEHVGGKNASLGEMISNLASVGVDVPGGFATTAKAFREFLAQSGIDDRINEKLNALDVNDVNALAAAGKEIRQWVIDTPFQPELTEAIESAYAKMQADAKSEFSVAVRSSATAEDLPDASFAGQQETFLNVDGIDNVMHSIKEVFASLFNDRAISYRVHQGFEHSGVALSAGIQRMVRSDISASGVMFTLDTESGFRDAVFITSSYGLGEMVVQGAVNPDEFYVHKPTLEAGRPAVLRRNLGSKLIKMVYNDDAASKDPVKVIDTEPATRVVYSLTDAEVEKLSEIAITIEKHYERPMDIEWAKDGLDGQLYIVQARPETVQSRAGKEIERYSLNETANVLVEGRSIGQKIGSGPARVIDSIAQMDQVQEGDVLVTDMTDPDWEPIMKRASAIVTNRGGRTCHAAIIARELGIPAVVGCGDATDHITQDQEVTVSCAEGDTGFIYQGLLDFHIDKINLDSMPEIPVKVMMN